MYNGIINIHKEKGFTSHDVVAKLRGILKQKKIGHTGTLDPDATGVLPVCLGSGTKLCDILTDKNKTYETVLLLGQATDTQDISGTVTASVSDINWNDEAYADENIRHLIASFEGEYAQIPPMYSALKVNGKKLYELAREGIEIERKARKVFIHKIEILEIDLPRIRMRVSCSKGTYIRTLCHDIGEKLGTFGCMEALIRTKTGAFVLEDAITLAQVEEAVKAGCIEEYIVLPDKMFEEYPAVYTKEEFDKILLNGNGLQPHILQVFEDSYKEKDFVRVYDSKKIFRGIYRYEQKKKAFQVYKMFL